MRGLLFFLLAAVPSCHAYTMPSTPGVSASDQVVDGTGLGHIRLRPQVCSGLSLAPETGDQTFESVVVFLRGQGLDIRPSIARVDLQYLDVPVDSKHSVRLRVAVLPSQPRAGEELHEAMTRQGTGSWGVRRGTVAILGPVGHVSDIIAFASKSKLACWGVLSIQDGDDTVTVPGGYLEF